MFIHQTVRRNRSEFKINFNTHDYVLTHSTVVTTNLLHCNWGWNGTYNGYFTVLNSCSVGSDVYVNLGMIISIDVI